MFLTDYLPAAARDRADRRPRRARGRRRAAGARCCANPSASTRSARRATSRSPATRPRARPTRCRGTPGRRSTSVRRSSSSGSRRCRRARSRRSTPASSTEDEIDLCLRWPDVPRPASATPAPPYPNVPTLILQGAEDLRTPPEWSARIQQRIPGAMRLVDPRRRALDGRRRAPARSTRSPHFARDRRPPSSCPRLPTGVPAVEAPPASFESLRGYPGLPRKVGRTVRAVGGDDRRPPARALPGGARRPPAAGCAAARGRSRARPADPARLPGRARRHGVGQRSTATFRAARRRLQGRARDAHARRGPSHGRDRRARGSPCAQRARTTRRPPPPARPLAR